LLANQSSFDIEQAFPLHENYHGWRFLEIAWSIHKGCCTGSFLVLT